MAEHEAALVPAREVAYCPEQARAHDGLARAHRALLNSIGPTIMPVKPLISHRVRRPRAGEMRAFLAEAQQTA